MAKNSSQGIRSALKEYEMEMLRRSSEAVKASRAVLGTGGGFPGMDWGQKLKIEEDAGGDGADRS